MLGNKIEKARKQKVSLTFKEKAKILKLLESKLKTQKDIAAEYGISDTTISNWRRQKDVILKMASSKFINGKSKFTTGKHPELEKGILEFMRIMRDHKLPINADVIKVNAKEIATKLCIHDFKASDGWYSGFKRRHDLAIKKTIGHEDRIDHDIVDKWREDVLPKILGNYSLDQIYNADETGLFFELLPDRTLTTKYDMCKFYENSKNRLTILLAVNFTGSDKLLPLIIGKSKTPRCFKNVKSLPVIYESNKSAWMTSEIFNSWLKKVDRQMVQRRKKIILLIDNAPCHNLDPSLVLENVTVEYLPSNSTSVLQPLDQGIIKCYKSHYKKGLLRMLVNKIKAKIILKKVSLLEAIYLTTEAWDIIEKEVIFNCFNHALRIQKSSENNDLCYEVKATEDIQELQAFFDTSSSFDEICNVNSTFIKETVAVDNVVATVIENISNTNVIDKNFNDDEAQEEFILKKPKHQVVHESLNTLRNFLTCTENVDIELFQFINRIRTMISLENEDMSIQTKLEDHGFVLK